MFRHIGRPDKLPGVYKNLDPIQGAIESVNKLLKSKYKYTSYQQPLIIQMHGLTKDYG